MLQTNDYEIVKENLISSQRLFEKLRTVIYNASNLDYDGNGFYGEQEKVHERHKKILSLKILDALSIALEAFTVNLIDQKNASLYELLFDIKSDITNSLIKVDFSEENSLNIVQLS